MQRRGSPAARQPRRFRLHRRDAAHRDARANPRLPHVGEAAADAVPALPRRDGSWDLAFLDALAKAFTVVIFDYSGLGRSTGAQLPARGHGTGCRRPRRGARPDKLVIGGWSLGGIAAQIFAARHPTRVSHAVLIGTVPPGRSRTGRADLPAHRDEAREHARGRIHPFFEPGRPRAAPRRRLRAPASPRAPPISARRSARNLPAPPQGIARSAAAFRIARTMPRRSRMRPPSSPSTATTTSCFRSRWYALNRTNVFVATFRRRVTAAAPISELAAQTIANFVRNTGRVS